MKFSREMQVKEHFESFCIYIHLGAVHKVRHQIRGEGGLAVDDVGDGEGGRSQSKDDVNFPEGKMADNACFSIVASIIFEPKIGFCILFLLNFYEFSVNNFNFSQSSRVV